MHSEGFELTKLTYTWLKDTLIRHRGDRYTLLTAVVSSCVRRWMADGYC